MADNRGRTRRRGRSSPIERYLPLAYMAAALVLVAVLLPSALRPPAQQSTDSESFSPNAPHQNQQSIIAAFQQAQSGTAGAGVSTGSGSGSGPTTTTTTLPIPPVKQVANFCPNGFGSPPRQTADVYSGPCAPAWHGNNGGATWQGVTSNQIKICVEGTGSTAQPSANGPVATQESASQNDWDRTYTVFQQYFNQNFELYGRQIQLIVQDPSGSTISDEETAGVACDQSDGVFASATASEPECSYFGQHGIVAFCGDHWPDDYYQQGAPNLYGWVESGNEDAQFTAEFICKQLAGKDAQWAGESDYQHETRKFGMLLYDTRGYQELGPILQAELKSECNQSLDVIYSDLDTTSGEESLAEAVTKFKEAGVTTVIPNVDWISSAAFTDEAAQANWDPEWLVTGGGYLDRNELGSAQDQAEWAHAFGFTDQEMERPLQDTDCYRAYQTIDPANTPDFEFCDYVYDPMYMLMTGIQDAGPDLTPTTFQKGLYSLGFRYPTQSPWAMGGGYGPGHPAYSDSIAPIWWSSTTPPPDPNTYGTSGLNDDVGTYLYVTPDKRYRPGQIPTTPFPFFTQGTTTPVNPTQYGD